MTHNTHLPDLNSWDESQVVDDWGAEDADVTVNLPKKKLEEADMDITPMIDITFLLLIFFIVASRIDAQSQVTLPKAHNGTAVPAKSSVMITMTQGSGDTAIIYKGDATEDSLRVATSDLAEQEEELIEYINNGITNERKEQVIIKAEKDVKARELSRVARAVGQVEGARLFVAVLEQQ